GVIGGAFPYGPRNTLIGVPQTYTDKNGETLIELAPGFDIGYNEIADANRGVDPWVPGKGARINIPSFKVLPNGPHRGIVINLAEMRLYYYLGRRLVISYPVGIGMPGFPTPTGVYRITQKITNPAWHVPAQIRRADPDIPLFVPAGSDNPMGLFALRLSRPTYLIHGTNRTFCVGLRASHGCIRLYNPDMKRLFRLVRKNTPVTIIYQPVKLGVRNGAIYVEAHTDYLHRQPDPLDAIGSELAAAVDPYPIDMKKLKRALRMRTGMPVKISARAGLFPLP
nr:L,D-transpeptidase family protein [Nitrospiraceae bacterium]